MGIAENGEEGWQRGRTRFVALTRSLSTGIISLQLPRNDIGDPHMGRPRIYASDAERQRAFRARRRIQLEEQRQAPPATSAALGTAAALVAPLQPEDTGAASEPGADGLAAVWTMIEEIWKSVPEEEMARLPIDGAHQH